MVLKDLNFFVKVPRFEKRVVEFCFPDPNYGIETKQSE